MNRMVAGSILWLAWGLAADERPKFEIAELRQQSLFQAAGGHGDRQRGGLRRQRHGYRHRDARTSPDRQSAGRLDSDGSVRARHRPHSLLHDPKGEASSKRELQCNKITGYHIDYMHKVL